MGRLHDAYQQREVHLGVVSFLVFVTNCRYIATDQPDAACAIVPLVFQCIGLLTFLVGSRSPDTRQSALARVCHGSIVLGSTTSAVWSVVNVHHLLPCTVPILNAYVLGALATDLWFFQQETVASSV